MRPLSYGVITALFAITMITIPIRIWVRGVTLQAFSWDDWMMASMLVRLLMQPANRVVNHTDAARANDTLVASRSSSLRSKLFCIFSSTRAPACKSIALRAEAPLLRSMYGRANCETRRKKRRERERE